MNRLSLRYLIGGFALLALVNLVVLLGMAWNRLEPMDSRLLLTERELSSAYTYWRNDNSSQALHLHYRWPSRDGDDYGYAPISAEKMAELGFSLPTDLNDESVRRYRRQLERNALLVLEFNGPAYQHEVVRAQTAQSEATRLYRAVPDSEALRAAAENASKALEFEQNRASRLLVVDAGLDQQALRSRYPDRQRYAIVQAIVDAQANSVAVEWTGEGDDPRPASQRWVWQLGGSAQTPGIERLNLPNKWHASLQQSENKSDGQGALFNAELAFGRRLEPWFIAFSPRD